jgi:bacterioferritin (cytochrome b1)
VAATDYNAAVVLAAELRDDVTMELLSDILADENDHAADLEAFQDQIAAMGLPGFVQTLVVEE